MQDGLTIAIAGMTGTGKTSFLRQSLRERTQHALLFDVRHEHNWCETWQPKDGAGYSVWEAMADCEEKFTHETEPQLIRVCPPGGDAEVWCEYLAKQAYFIGDMIFALEEADLFSQPNYDNPGVNTLHNYSRNRGVNFIYLTRNLPAVSRALTSSTKAWVLFRQEEPLYLAKLEARFEPALVDAVAGLQDFEFVQVNRDRTWLKSRVEQDW